MSGPREESPKVKKIVIGISILLVALIGYSYVSSQIAANNEHEARILRKEAEAARLASDPITTSGIYAAVNKQRDLNGAKALSTVSNLTASSKKMCADMVKYDYFDYKNPKTGKKANSFITDKEGDLYYKTYVTSIFDADESKDTATDAVKDAMKYQSENIADPAYNSVGWAICADPNIANIHHVVGSFAEKADKPAPVYTPAPTYTAPAPSRSLYCNTQYYSSLDSSSTTCF